jgi:hypothetical protein
MTPADEARFIALWQQGLETAAIAQALGIPPRHRPLAGLCPAAGRQDRGAAQGGQAHAVHRGTLRHTGADDAAHRRPLGSTAGSAHRGTPQYTHAPGATAHHGTPECTAAR